MNILARYIQSAVVTFFLMGAAASTNTANASITSASIIPSAISTNCMDYKIVGVCLWLYCGWTGCRIRTSVKVGHYVPELVVSSYQNTGKNPWLEIAALSPPLGEAMAGGQSTRDLEPAMHQQLRFKNVDAIGHPGASVFNRFADRFGFTCRGATSSMRPYFISTLDALAWRSGIPESVYPEALIPGRRELGKPGDMWGNVYPRSGFISQTHDYKSAALMAQRAADIVTREGQPHVYLPIRSRSRARDGYWPPGPVKEGDKSHQWQDLYPNMRNSCALWPDKPAQHTYSERLDEGGDYAFALWRQYKCCKRRGFALIGDYDF